MLLLSIQSDIKFGVLDIIRNIGMAIIKIVFDTIDVLYDVAQKINSLNFINMLENIPNSPFTKLFNAFFILSFTVLLLFAIWKITFKILDGDSQETSLFELIKEIFKSGILIFCVYLIFNTGINLGVNLSNAIYNNFSSGDSSIGETMKSAYLGTNDDCYLKVDGGSVDEENVKNIKDILKNEVPSETLSKITTVEDLEELIRGGEITASDLNDAEAFNHTCGVYEPGIWNDGEEYVFSYNFLFGIIIGAIFLFAIGFAVLMLGKRQLEIAFLMVIAPLVFATSVGRKEQRQALYQQLASLVLQAGALMLLIGLTSIMFTAIQNSSDINNLPFFTKLVAQSILYLGCAMMLLTGSTALNRFIGENISANSGRDMMLAMSGLAGGMMTAGAIAKGSVGLAAKTAVGTYKTGKGLGQLAKAGGRMAKGMYHGVASVNPGMKSSVSKGMNNKFAKGVNDLFKGGMYQQSNSGIARAYGRYLSNRGESNLNNLASQWDFTNDKYNPEYIRSGVDLAKQGISNIKNGYQTFKGNNRLGNPRKNYISPKLYAYGNESDKI